MMRVCSLVLTAALFGLAAAQSPLDEVNFDGAIKSLTIYFKSLAHEVLNAEVAEVSVCVFVCIRTCRSQNVLKT